MEDLLPKQEEASVVSFLDDLKNLGISPDESNKVKSLQIGEKLTGETSTHQWVIVKEGEDNYNLSVTEIDSTLQLLKKRLENPEGLTEVERAKKYWYETLFQENRIKEKQNEKCQIAIVVPVYNENLERIVKQIDSLRSQSIDPSLYEVIYVVNKDIDDSSEKSKQVSSVNENVIEFIKSQNYENIFVIDKSSKGNEIEKCNVGKARNRGVAEASIRFYENNKNGVLIQTDADAYFQDPNYLSSTLDILKENSDVIGIAGGLVIEYDPGNVIKESYEFLHSRAEKFILKKKWDLLIQFFKNPSPVKNDNFSGANMISKSLESAVIGGIIDTNYVEDDMFGESLKLYAHEVGKRVIEMKNELQVTTALRDSDRTDASFKKDFEAIDLDKPILVPNFIPNAEKYIPLTEENYQRLVQKVSETKEGQDFLNSFRMRQLSHVKFKL